MSNLVLKHHSFIGTDTTRKIIDEWFSVSKELDQELATATKKPSSKQIDRILTHLAASSEFQKYINETNNDIIENIDSYEDLSEKYK